MPRSAAMAITRQQMLDAMYRRDPALKGRFVVAVTSTRIYCLPDCPARKPKPDNVVFFLDERDAVSAGYRACKRCRPDAWYRGRVPELEALELLVAQMRTDPARFADIAAVATHGGFGTTKLAALLRRHYHAAPAALLNGARIGRARELLGGGATPVEAALGAGYASSSAFYRNFLRATGMTPGEYRRLGTQTAFAVRLPEDYLLEPALRLLGRDVDSPAERRAGSRFQRAVELDGQTATMRIEFEPGWARVALESAARLSPAAVRLSHETLLRLFGLDCEPEPFLAHLARERIDGADRLVAGRRSLRLQRFASVFETAAWAIIGQQINLPFAYRLRGAMIELCGRPAPGGLRAPPAAPALAALDYADLTRRRYSRRKAEYLIDLARLVATGQLDLEALSGGPATRGRERLLELRGIGPWTADYVLMRGGGFADCVPIGDAALLAALQRFHRLDDRPDTTRTAELMSPYAPYRSFATHHYWASLGDAT